MDTTKFIWRDGVIEEWDNTKEHVLTHTLHYGTGVFEGIRFYETKKGPAIFRLEEHINRLFKSAKVLGLEINFSKKELINAIILLVKKNNIKSGYIRPLVYFGYGKMGLDVVGAKTNIIIAMWPWGAYLGEEGKRKGITAKISDYSRHNQKKGLNLVKATGFYVNSMLAKMDALKNGFKEAILLNSEKNIAECTGENIFIIKGKKIFTPKDDSCLKGITRDTIIKLAKDNRFKVLEKDISQKELLESDGCFLTGTAAEVTSIVSVNQKKIGKGIINPIAKKLQEDYDKLVRGENEKYFKWLTFVYD